MRAILVAALMWSAAALSAAADPKEMQAVIDRQSRLITRAVGLVSAGPRAIRFQTDFSDFREVDGVIFPFREENHASGVHIGRTTVTSILINPPDERLVPGAAREEH